MSDLPVAYDLWNMLWTGPWTAPAWKALLSLPKVIAEAMTTVDARVTMSLSELELG